MEQIDPRQKKLGYMVVLASWLAVFCLFGYRSTFSVLLGPMSESMNWSVSQTSLGYSLMMTIYAVTAFFSGMIIDKWGTRPAYLIGAVFAALGFYVTSLTNSYFQYLACYAILAGVGTGMLWVSSTVSVRKWFVGSHYAKMWGLAFMGAPVAQVILSIGVKEILVTMDWRQAMQGLAVVVFIALVIAGLVAKKNPEDYGYQPVGMAPSGGGKSAQGGYNWGVKEAFSTWPIWGTIIAFLGSMLAEFLIWSQVVMYWTTDLQMPLSKATNLYVLIGIVGIFSMPLMGVVADKVVDRFGNEAKGRKAMLIFGPAMGIVACICLLLTRYSIVFGIVSCFLFAVYWAIEPGGCAGYAGAIYGGKSLGKIWGLATLVVMGIGPAVGSFMGGFLYDLSGSYFNSIIFALCTFVVSTIAAFTLPLSAKPKTVSDKVETAA
jgi:OFA family oxalate/formate antiporter-like MFS transporter